MPAPALQLDDATLRFGNRQLWSGVDLAVRPGEFLAILGANGSGKTSLLRCILSLQRLTAGRIAVAGVPARAARRRIGYIPQQRQLDPLVPVRARDMVGFGIDGHRWGVGGRGRRRRERVDAALLAVGAATWADRPVAQLSGGQQQLVRMAQALAGDPELLLCDEPLLSLDLTHQRAVASVINERRITHSTAVVFVTHEINPILPYVDRVLYLAGGRYSIGTVDTVLTSETLTELYGSPVEVLRVNGRIVVVGGPDAAADNAPVGSLAG